MQIVKNIQVPTGNLLIVKNKRGQLFEVLALRVYKKNAVTKADFLGLEGNLDEKVLEPFSEKMIISICTQFGCKEMCAMCDGKTFGDGTNASYEDLINQVEIALYLNRSVKHTKQLTLHYLRVGEPTWNPNVPVAAAEMFKMVDMNISTDKFFQNVSTMMPKYNKNLERFLEKWLYLKNDIFNGNMGLQISLNSTSDYERNQIFAGRTLSISEISDMLDYSPRIVGRKINLNFPVADWEIDPDVLLKYFDPDKYAIKLTPVHQTKASVKAGLRSPGEFESFDQYLAKQKEMEDAGYDTIVALTTTEEDTSRITCGNAILSDGTIKY